MKAVADHIAIAMERVRAHKALRESEHQFRELAESIPQVVWMVQPDGFPVYFNRRWQDQFGNSAMRPLAGHWEELVHPEEREPAMARWTRCLQTGEPYRMERRLRVSNGEYRWFLARAIPVRDDQGRITRWFGTCTDIQDSKNAEERVRQAQKLESIGLLAGGVAHDFNNLLTGIMGNASLLMDEVGPTAIELLHAILRSAERAAHLTRQLLAYSGKGQFIVKDLHLSQSVREMLDLVRLSVPKSVDLRFDLRDQLPLVTMDPAQLQQLVMNLVINAGEAIGEGNRGGITVRTGMRDFHTPFSDALGNEVAPRRYVYLEVADTGAGMDESVKSRIFDPFFTTKFTGRGLGLAAVSGIVRSLDGAITVSSAPGQGTAFRIFFPAAQTGREQAKEEPALASRGTILVVDDEESVRSFITAVLRRCGYRVHVACDGAEALTICDREIDRLDAVILDIVMPVMGGKEFLREIRRRRPGLKVLLTSGYSETEARRLCESGGDFSFIQKPYTVHQLAQAAADLLHQQ